MRVLGIETSCDETAAAVVETTTAEFETVALSNIVHSQINEHSEFGGIVPNIAKREHERLLVPIIIKALEKIERSETEKINISKVEKFFEKNKSLFQSFKDNSEITKKPNVDLIAVTNGPGLEPALWVGVVCAKALSILWNIPVLGVDHMRGHIAANFVREKSETLPEIKFPAIALTISGGHTQLVFMEKPLRYKLIGETADDAAGEAFDKVARMLNLPYPGGPSISKEARLGNKNSYNLPRPLINSKDYRFSFSGLKTAVKYLIRDLGEQKARKETANIAASFQQALIESVTLKTARAAKEYNAQTIIMGGGVSANEELRLQLKEAARAISVDYRAPKPYLSTDNAAMIACCGALEYSKNKKTDNPETLSADSNRRIDSDN